VSKVAAGRNKSYAEIDAIAQGKIWTGTQGLKLGLVDQLGGMREAEAKIKELAKIKGEAVYINTCKTDGMEVSLEMSPMMKLFPLGAAIQEMDEYLKLYQDWKQYQGEKVLFATPTDLEQLSQP
jgi:protease-4